MRVVVAAREKGPLLETGDLIAMMRARVEKCRRLARSITDARTIEALNEMADEGEADIERLIAESKTG